MMLLWLTGPLLARQIPVSDREKQPHQFIEIVWTADDGLPDNFISDILQTSDGFLWLATENGISRFDGVSFTNMNRRTQPVMLSNRVSTLYEDNTGILWFGTFGGGLYAIRKDTVVRFTDAEGLPSNYVTSIAEDAAGSIWVGTNGEGLGRIEADTVLTYSEDQGVSRHIHTLYTDGNNTMWIGAQDGLYLNQNGTFTRHPLTGQLPAATILDIHESEGVIHVATPYGIASIDGGSVHIPLLANSDIYARTITTDQDGHIWAATIDKGALRVRGGTASGYIFNDMAEYRDINVVYSDREGNIWIGSRNMGIIQLRDETVTTYTERDGLPTGYLFSVTEGDDGVLWLGSTEGLIRLSGMDVQSWEPGPSDMEKLVFSVHSDATSTIWIGTRTGKLMKLDNGLLTDTGLPEVRGRAVWVVSSDSRGNIWAGTNYGLYRLKDGEITRFSTRDSMLTHNDVRAIAEARDGTLWIGTSFGLNALKDGKMSHYTDGSGLADLIVVALHADDEGDLWAGTYGGLHRVRDGVISVVTMEHGLPFDMIGTILEDDSGNLWMGGTNGIFRVNKAEINDFIDGKGSTFTVRRFGRSDGMKDETVRLSIQPAGWKARNGTLWFATNDGVAGINPADVTVNPVPPVVHIISAEADGNHSGHFRSVPSLELPRNHNQVEISYAAPTYIRPDAIRFRYMLEGMHTEWLDAGTRRSAWFSRIPPGEYIFRVIAANEDGYWSEAGASFPIFVLPPFWMTWWFRTLVIVFFLTTGPVIYYRRVSGLEKKQNQQQEFTRKLIDSQEAERARIAAELHDSLGQNMIVIKNRALMGQQKGADDAVIADQLEEISKTASATLEEMRKISYNLKPFNLERFGLTRSMTRAVEEAASSSPIRLSSEIDPIDKLMKPGAEVHLFRIIQEALNNILKHSQAETASVSIHRGQKFIHISIRDDGIGFDSSPDTGTAGFGLDNLRQRAALIGGKLTIQSKADRGTILNLTIPIQETA
jgi:signal transduction histidine kinase/ligand-binding sensor domain-containing protein